MSSGPFEDRTPSSPIVTKFLERYLDDIAAGKKLSLADYQTLFPGYDAAIEKEFRAIADDSGSPSPEAAESPMIDGIPSQLGPYRLKSKLGFGGYGAVFLAEDERLGRLVALKILKSGEYGGPLAEARFRREAEISALFSHPNIASLLDCRFGPPVSFLAMRYVEGETLAKRILAARESPVMPTPLVDSQESFDHAARVHAIVEFFAKAARALAAAHSANIVHRDVKPANIIVTPAAEPVILDFGLARNLEETPLTQSLEVFGTVPYMPPELIEHGRVSPSGDVYSLAATLYETLVGERPVKGKTAHEVLLRATTESVVPLRILDARIPTDLQAIVAVGLDPDPDRRYRSMNALADDLSAFLEGRPIAARPAGPLRRIASFGRRRPALFALVCVLAVTVPTIGGLLAYAWWTKPKVIELESRRRRETADLAIERGFLELGQLRHAESIRAFDEALALVGDDAEALGGKVLALLVAKRPRDAEAELNARSAHVEKDPALDSLKEEIAYDLEKSAGTALPPPNLDAPPSPTATWYFFAGWRTLRRDESLDPKLHERALDFFTRACLLSRTTKSVFHFERARAAGLCRDKKAVEECVQAIRTHWPQSATGAFYAGFALTGIGEYAAAVDILERGRAIDPKHRLVRLMLGAAWMGVDKNEDSAAIFRDLVAEDAKDWTAHQNLAHVLTVLGDREGALEHYEEAIKYDPRNASAWGQIAALTFELGRLDKAAAAAKKVLEINPEDPSALNVLGCLAGNADENAEALDFFRRAAVGWPDKLEVHRNIVEAARMLGQGEIVLEETRRFAAARPADADAQTELVKLLLVAADDDEDLADECTKVAERAAELTEKKDAARLLDWARACRAADRMADMKRIAGMIKDLAAKGGRVDGDVQRAAEKMLE